MAVTENAAAVTPHTPPAATEAAVTLAPVEYLSAADILNVQDRFWKDVPMPEWKTLSGKPGTLRLQSLTSDEIAEYVEATTGPAKRNALALMLMRAAVGGNGRPLFNDESQSAAYLAALRGKSMSAFMRVQRVVLEMNGLDDKTQGTAKNG